MPQELDQRAAKEKGEQLEQQLDIDVPADERCDDAPSGSVRADR